MKKLTLSLLAASVALGASAEVLTPAQALQRAGGNFARVAGTNVAAAPVPVLTVKAADSQPAIYIFNDGANSGYRVISADDVAVPVLGYSDSGSLDPQAIPANMKAWLDFYAAEIEAARAAGATEANTLRVSRPSRKAIAPICKTKWNQDAPYNNMCPKSGLSATYTGCVATAMAQVLKTYEYPEACSGGTFSYYAQTLKKNISLNFDNVTLDWANMLDTYGTGGTTAQKNAVANLMYAVGVSAQMDYGTSASGTLGLYMASGLVRNFDYDKSLLYVLREWYTTDQWESIIYDQLAGGHAAYYDGSNGPNGHAFVVDGYQGDGYFHLNWGWGGVSDGYFLLSGLDPTNQGIGGSNAGYNIGQGTMLNMKPSDGQTTVIPQVFQLDGTFTVSNTVVNKGSSVTISGGTFKGEKGGFWNVSPCTIESARLGIKFTPTNGGNPTYAISTTTYNNLQQYYGSYNYAVTIPTALPSGTYVVTPVSRDGKGNNFDVMGRVGGFTMLYATVAGSRVTFTYPEYASIEASDLNVAETLYQNTNAKVTATLTNNTDQYFNDQVSAAMVNYNGTTITLLESSLASLINLEPGEETTCDITFAISTKSTVGSHYICLVDGMGKVISDLVSVTVQANPGAGVITTGNISAVSKVQNKLQFKFNARCTEGYYSNGIYIYLFENNSAVTSFVSDLVNLAAGESQTVYINGSFDNGVPGNRYQAIAFYLDGNSLKQCSNAISFTLQAPEVNAIGEIEADNDAPVEYFDVMGRKVETPKAGTTYIRHQGTKASKVFMK